MTFLRIAFALFALGVLLALFQMWSDYFERDTFLKLIITDGALLVLLIVWAVVARERRETEKLRRDQTLK